MEDVRAKLTKTPTRMLFPYTNPAHDVDVSQQVQGDGGVEMRETKLVRGQLEGLPA